MVDIFKETVKGDELLSFFREKCIDIISYNVL